ncbi:hydrophobin 3 precursor [Ophiocordyceps camponoti-floridani]|uniref:Hydrophobin 3 n=1 Tax=Ophiocordyceps camponoti-floridani TaxID=2030778 RepID=A0A8H4VB81_9HYPO|nr:hydrophobin 3 precursor [Ophiocordyceps camponoti-floridani]
MKCSAAVSVLALAVAAVAIPMEKGYGYAGDNQYKRGLEHPGFGDEKHVKSKRNEQGNRGDDCSAHSRKQVCCDGGLGCLVQVLGDRCGANAYCCNTSSGPGTAVDLRLLSCLKL